MICNNQMVYKMLHAIFPKNPELADRWPNTPNKAFGGETPESVMKDGDEGMDKVVKYLSSVIFK